MSATTLHIRQPETPEPTSCRSYPLSVSSGSPLVLSPLSIKAACVFVAEKHRHNKPPQGALFAVGARIGEQLVGAAIIGRPVARMLADGKTCEVTRLCTDGTPNACSLLYGAAARAAKALGYARIITYILTSEPGTSLRAAGWIKDADVKAEASWTRPSRSRINAERPAGPKTRWVRKLSSLPNDATASRELPALDCKRPQQPGPSHLANGQIANAANEHRSPDTPRDDG